MNESWPNMPITCYGAVRLSVGLSVQRHPFPCDNSKFYSYHIDTWYIACLPYRPLGKPISICFGIVTLIFKVTEVTKVKFHFWSITQNVLELSTWGLVQTLVWDQTWCLFILRSLGWILSLGHWVQKGQNCGDEHIMPAVQCYLYYAGWQSFKLEKIPVNYWHLQL